MSRQMFSDAMSELNEKYIMEAEAYQAPRRISSQKWILRAASILLAIFVGGGVILTFDATARAAVLGWVSSQYENWTRYSFNGDKEKEELKLYYPAWIPEECEFVTLLETGDYGETYIYTDQNDIIIQFSYQAELGVSELYLATEDSIRKDVKINGNYGELYISTNPAETNALVWQDEENHTMFWVTGPYEEDILIKMAENVKVKE